MKEEFRILSARTLRALAEGLNESNITHENVVCIIPTEVGFNALYTVTVYEDAETVNGDEETVNEDADNG